MFCFGQCLGVIAGFKKSGDIVVQYTVCRVLPGVSTCSMGNQRWNISRKQGKVYSITGEAANRP
jgi:hypothetical protein